MKTSLLASETIVVLGTTHWPTIQANPKLTREAVE